MASNEVKLSVNINELTRIIESRLSRIPFTPKGSSMDEAFKEILSIRQREFQEAISNMSISASKISEEIIERIGTKEVGKRLGNQLQPIVKYINDQVQEIAKLSTKGTERFVQSDMQKLVTAVNIAARSMETRVNPPSLNALLESSSRFQTMLAPTNVQDLQLRYGKNKYLGKGVELYRKSVEEIYKVDDGIENALKIRPELSKDTTFRKLKFGVKAIKEKLNLFKEDFRSEADKVLNNELSAMPDLLEMLKGTRNITRGLQNSLGVFGKGGKLTSSQMTKIVDASEAPKYKSMYDWLDTVNRKRAVSGKAQMSDTDIYNPPTYKRSVDDKNSETIKERAYVHGETTKRVMELREKVMRLITEYKSVLERDSDVKNRLHKLIVKSSGASEKGVTTTDKIDVHLNDMERLATPQSVLYGTGTSKEWHGTKLAVDKKINDYENEVIKLTSYLKRLDEEYKKAGYERRTLNEITSGRGAEVLPPRGSIGGPADIMSMNPPPRGGGGDGRSSRDFGDSFVRMATEIKKASSEYREFSLSFDSIVKRSAEFKKKTGLTDQEFSKLVDKGTKMGASMENMLGMAKSERTILGEIDNKYTSILNKTEERRILEEQLAKFEKLRERNIQAGGKGKFDTATEATIKYMGGRVDYLSKGIGDRPEEVAKTETIDSIQRMVNKYKEAKIEYDKLKSSIASGASGISKEYDVDGKGSEIILKSMVARTSQIEKEQGLLSTEEKVLRDIKDLNDKILITSKEKVLYQKELDSLLEKEKTTKLSATELSKKSILTKEVASRAKVLGEEEPKESIQEKAQRQIQEAFSRIEEARITLDVLRKQRAELQSSRGKVSSKDEASTYNAQIKALDQMIKQTEDLSKGWQKSMNPIKRLGDGLKGLVVTMRDLAEWQAVWYASKYVVGLPTMILGQGLDYAKSIEEWKAKMLRWGATSGQVTDKMKADVEGLSQTIRAALIEVPGDFEKTSDAVQSLLGAGLKSDTVKELARDMAILKASFPEIQMEQFGIAAVGAFNVFKDQIKGASTESGKFRIILEQLLRAQAESIIRPEQFTKVMQYMSAIGKIAGYSTEQIFALSTTLADTGITAANASRLLGSFIVQMSRGVSVGNLRDLGIVMDSNKTSAENLSNVMNALRSKIKFGDEGAPQKILTYFQKFMPKEEIKILLTLIDKWDEYEKRAKRLKDSKGTLGPDSSLLKSLQSSLPGQMQLLKNTLNEVGALGDSTVGIFKKLVISALDGARGALMAVNPVMAKTAFDMDSLGSSGRVVYSVVTSIKSVLEPLIKVIAAVAKPILSIVEALTQFKTAMTLIIDFLFVRWTVGLAKSFGPQIMSAITARILAMKAAMSGLPTVGASGAAATASQVVAGQAAGTLFAAGASELLTPVAGRIGTGGSTLGTQLGRAGASLKAGEYVLAASGAGGALATLGKGVLSFMGPQAILMAALTAGVYLWEKSSEAQSENKDKIDKLKDSIASLNSELLNMSKEGAREGLDKLEKIANKSKEGLDYEHFTEWFTGPKTTDRQEFMERTDKRLVEEINRYKDQLELATKSADAVWAAEQKANPNLAGQERKQSKEEVNIQIEIDILGQTREFFLKNMPRGIKRKREVKDKSPVFVGTDNMGVPIYAPVTENREEITPAQGEHAIGELLHYRRGLKDKYSKEKGIDPNIDIPEPLFKEFGTQSANLIRENLNLILSLIKGHYDRVEELENDRYKLGFESAKEHYDNMSILINSKLKTELKTEIDLYKSQLDALEAGRRDAENKIHLRAKTSNAKDIQAFEDKEKEYYMTNVYNKQVQQAALQHTVKMREILKKHLSGSLGEWMKYYEARKEIADLNNKLEASYSDYLFNFNMDKLQGSVDRQGMIVSDLYNREKISAKEYYDWLDRVREFDLNKGIAAANQEYESWHINNKSKIEEAQGVFTTFNKLKNVIPDMSPESLKLFKDGREEIKKYFEANKIEIPLILNKESLDAKDLEEIKKLLFVPGTNIETNEKIRQESVQKEMDMRTKINKLIEASNNTLIKNQIEMANNIRSLYGDGGLGGIARVLGKTFEEMGAKFRNVGQNISDSISSIFHTAENSLVEFFDVSSEKYGDFASLGKSISAEMTKEFSRTMITKPLMGLITGDLENVTKSVGGSKILPSEKVASVGFMSSILEFFGVKLPERERIPPPTNEYAPKTLEELFSSSRIQEITMKPNTVNLIINGKIKTFENEVDNSIVAASAERERVKQLETEQARGSAASLIPTDFMFVKKSADGSTSIRELVEKYFKSEDVSTMMKIIQAESGGNPNAKNRSGASGLTQIMPMHFDALKKAGILENWNDIFDPGTNIRAAAFLRNRRGDFEDWNASKYDPRNKYAWATSGAKEYVDSTPSIVEKLSKVSPAVDSMSSSMTKMSGSFETGSDMIRKAASENYDATNKSSTATNNEVLSSNKVKTENDELAVKVSTTIQEIQSLNAVISELRNTVNMSSAGTTTVSDFQASNSKFYAANNYGTWQTGSEENLPSWLKLFGPLMAGMAVGGVGGKNAITSGLSAFLMSSVVTGGITDLLIGGKDKSGKRSGGWLSKLFGGGSNSEAAVDIKDTTEEISNSIIEAKDVAKTAGDELVRNQQGLWSEINAIIGDNSDQIAKMIVGLFGKAFTGGGSYSAGYAGSGDYTGSTVEGFGQIYHKGGFIPKKFHTGGLNDDETIITAQRGEYVVRKEAVSKYGRAFMNSVNKGELRGRPTISAPDTGVTMISNNINASSSVNEKSKAPNISFNFINKNTNAESMEQGNMNFDGQKWICDILLKKAKASPEYRTAFKRVLIGGG